MAEAVLFKAPLKSGKAATAPCPAAAEAGTRLTDDPAAAGEAAIAPADV